MREEEPAESRLPTRPAESGGGGGGGSALNMYLASNGGFGGGGGASGSSSANSGLGGYGGGNGGAQFLPATYLVSGLEGMMLRQESLLANGFPAFALLITVFVGLFISYKLFRWEKEEKFAGRPSFGWVR